jgi:hypothetical protein
LAIHRITRRSDAACPVNEAAHFYAATFCRSPPALTHARAVHGGEAQRAFEAMMLMKKTDIATIEAARRG